ncbi:MAG TPA: hypothetical protein VH833_12600, partial [Gemmatimonadales bacterium]
MRNGGGIGITSPRKRRTSSSVATWCFAESCGSRTEPLPAATSTALALTGIPWLGATTARFNSRPAAINAAP